MSKPIHLEKGDRILICRTDRLGDLILTTPLIESLKYSCPQCEIDILASDYALPVLGVNNHMKTKIGVNIPLLHSDKNAQKELQDILIKRNYKVALMVYPDKIISKIVYKSKISIRIGTARRFQSIYFNRFLFHSRKANKKHESEYNLDFLKFFEPSKVSYTPHVYLMEDNVKTAKEILADANISGRFIVLHPGSGGSADRWPLEHFIELYYILNEKNYSVVFTGSTEENKEIEKFANKRDISLNNLAGKTDIRTLAGLLSLADIVVANSTGPLHLASAVGTRVIGLYPNRHAMSPKRWGPLGTGHQVILPPNRQNEMSAIKPEDIAKIAISMKTVPEVSE
ncbi:MAG: glycosyltransferase family 9 protein [candidate division Zixibacteria bacterium]|nr:glycosyltransferase family 9 protein [candidate division Zixibacteria bacterium]